MARVLYSRTKRPHMRTEKLRFRWILALLLTAVLLSCGSGSPGNSFVSPPPPPPPPSFPPLDLSSLVKLSTDTFSNANSQHATEVEPSAFAYGSTIVTAFQVGRIFGGGSADIGFATSTDNGITWENGFLPATTQFQNGAFLAISDPSVAYDAAHAVWLIASLGVKSNTDQVIVSRSLDGVTWNSPVTISSTPDADKNWIVCDNSPSSSYYGHCYVEWDDPSKQGIVWMSTSTDGGATWGAAVNTNDHTAGIGGVPVIQPDGTVVVPLLNWAGTSIIAFASADGGNTWTSSGLISDVTDHQVAGGLRDDALPSATVDASGTVYVVWQDCRFRTACAANDIVMSTSTNGATWSSATRIPIDASTSTADHFIPAIVADPSTGGSTARLALVYYFYSQTNCTLATCALNVGWLSSDDGGTTWNQASTLAGPMSLNWLPNTSSGYMVGDYVAATFSAGKLFPAIAVAQPNSATQFDEAIYTTKAGLTALRATRKFSSRNDRPVPNAQSDHGPRRFYDLNHRYAIPR